MNCKTCGALLDDNAKFCTACGANLAVGNVENTNTVPPSAPQNEIPTFQQPYVNTQQPNMQPFYGNNQAYNGQMPNGNTPKSNTGLKVALVACIAIIVWLFISLDDLQTQNDSYKNTINQYENENAIDKTFDAIDSWLDVFD